MMKKVLSLVGCLVVLLINGCKGVSKESVTVQVQDGFDQCQGEPFKIDLLNVLDALPEDSIAARTEQLRDWVWRTLLARLAAGGAGPELLASVAKQPLLRDESLAHILDVPVGRGRAAVDKEGTVYVLVDRSSPRRIREDALEAIDQEALLLGGMPKKAEIYGVTFKRSTAEAEVCRLGSYDQKWIRSPKQGFRHAKVATAEGLTSFLKGGVDLLSASCTVDGGAGGVELTGRVRPRDAGAPVTVEHIAALRASPEYVPVDRLPVEIPPEARSQASELGAQLDEALRLAEEQRAPLPMGGDEESEKFLAQLLEWRRQNPGVPTSELILSLQAQRARIDDLGFSLDPRPSGYQCARYDGPVAGTKSAMTMFYTDLLAKLWAINWRNAAPTGLIPGFVSVAEYPGASTYCEEDEGVPYTRIWFGSRQEGFIRDQSDKLRFAPNATRLFALGSAAGPDHSAEVEPAADMLRFIRWWDRSYSAVAEWEPQYELLNQLVKWTLVQRMAQAAPANCLSFLDQASVGRAERFDRWLANQKDLRWQGPLHAVNKPHEKTECLNLFKSAWFGRCGNLAMLSGGVGLPTTAEYASRPVRTFDPQPFSRRIDPERRADRAPDGTLRYPAIERPKGSLDEAELTVTADRAQLTGKLRSLISFRGDFTFRQVDKEGDAYRSLAFRQEDRLVDGGNGLESQESIEGFGVLRLSAADLRKGTVRLAAQNGVQSKANQKAQEMGRRRSGTDDFPTIAQQVAGDLPVFAVGPDEVVVQFRPTEGGEGVYAVMSSGSGVRGPPTGGGRWTTGNAEPPRRDGHDGHNGRWNSNRRVGVMLLPEREGKDYLQRMGAEPVRTFDPVVLDVREKLSRGDLEAARAVAESPGAPAWAVAAVAVHAIEHRRFGVAEKMIQRLQEEQAEAELRRVEQSLLKEQVDLARTGNSAQTLLVLRKLQMDTAFKVRRLSLEEAERWRDRNGENSSAILFASAQYPKDAGLPPVGHRPGKVLEAKDSYVLDVIAEGDLVFSLAEQKNRQSYVPRAIEIDGVPLLLRKLPGSTSPQPPAGRPEGGELEPFEKTPPILFIRPCTIQGEGTPGLPSCYRPLGPVGPGGGPLGPDGPDEPGDGGPLDFYLVDCDQDGDGSLNEESERDCAEERAAEAEQLKTVSFEP